MEYPKITIITVCFNAVSCIEQTIKSVINQTYPNIEYIIIEGNSIDGTIDIIEQYKDNITHWVSEPDKGIFDAMNKGIVLSHGDWVLFLNSGDYLYSDYVISQCFLEKDYSGFSVLYGDVYKDYVSEDRYYKEKPFYSSHKKIKGMGICHQAIFVQGNTIRGLKFDLSYKCCSDYNMMVQIYKEGGRFLSLNMPISVYSTIGFSVQQWKLCFYEEAKICGMHSSLLYKIILCKRIAFMMMRKILNISR